MPDFVVIPENKEQLIELVKSYNEYSIPIVPYTMGNNVGGLTISDFCYYNWNYKVRLYII